MNTTIRVTPVAVDRLLSEMACKITEVECTLHALESWITKWSQPIRLAIQVSGYESVDQDGRMAWKLRQLEERIAKISLVLTTSVNDDQLSKRQTNKEAVTSNKRPQPNKSIDEAKTNELIEIEPLINNQSASKLVMDPKSCSSEPNLKPSINVYQKNIRESSHHNPSLLINNKNENHFQFVRNPKVSSTRDSSNEEIECEPEVITLSSDDDDDDDEDEESESVMDEVELMRMSFIESRNHILPSLSVSRSIKKRNRRKDFICQYCGRSCESTTHLERHLRVHTNERPYQCSECEQSFKRKHHLEGHLLWLHTPSNLWPYQCELCHSRFVTRSELSRHQRSKQHYLPLSNSNTWFPLSSKATKLVVIGKPSI